MSDSVQVRVSARESFMWQLHVIIDGLPKRGRDIAFAREVLRQLGVPVLDLDGMAQRVARSLPKQFTQMGMNEVLLVLERAVPIRWIDDLVEVGDGIADSLKRQIIQIFEGVPRLAFPREVTGQILEAAAHALEPNTIPDDLQAGLRAAIENTLVHYLWRSRDAAARATLADRVIAHFRKEARLNLRPKADS